ncbi:hypothetical protein HYQ46_011581 [Verticillium longisporum]|nr:hypothetical protein HYQ46_011581 [Verticillium longisporum]
MAVAQISVRRRSSALSGPAELAKEVWVQRLSCRPCGNNLLGSCGQSHHTESVEQTGQSISSSFANVS